MKVSISDLSSSKSRRRGFFFVDGPTPRAISKHPIRSPGLVWKLLVFIRSSRSLSNITPFVSLMPSSLVVCKGTEAEINVKPTNAKQINAFLPAEIVEAEFDDIIRIFDIVLMRTRALAINDYTSR